MDEIRVGNPGFTPCASNAGKMTIPQNIVPPTMFNAPSIQPAIVAISSSLVKSPIRAAGLIVSSALMMPGSTKDTHMGAVLKNPVGSVNMFTNSTYIGGHLFIQGSIHCFIVSVLRFLYPVGLGCALVMFRGKRKAPRNPVVFLGFAALHAPYRGYFCSLCSSACRRLPVSTGTVIPDEVMGGGSVVCIRCHTLNATPTRTSMLPIMLV